MSCFDSYHPLKTEWDKNTQFCALFDEYSKETICIECSFLKARTSMVTASPICKTQWEVMSGYNEGVYKMSPLSKKKSILSPHFCHRSLISIYLFVYLAIHHSFIPCIHFWNTTIFVLHFHITVGSRRKLMVVINVG